MSSNINNFYASVKDAARPNRFRVIITYPTAVGTPNVLDEMVVKGAGLPAAVIGTVQVPYRGRNIPIPGDRTFEDWTITVLNDITQSHRNAFERWSNLILGFEGNIQNAPDFRSLVATITVQQLDRNDRVIKTVKMFNAFPTNVAQIDLDYSNNDQFSEFQVTFAYTHWESANTPTT